jgi:signal transduction histidine kinase
VVESRLWGAMVMISPQHEPFPESTEARLTDFTELVAAAIASAESRAALARLADEQAALRRVATLIAQGVQPDAIFSAVGEEIGRMFSSSVTTVGRFEPDAQALVAVGVGTGTEGIPIGSRWEIDDHLASGQVLRTGRSVRVDGVDWSAVRGSLGAIGSRLGVASTVASPIFVEGHLWGVVSVSDTEQLPPEAEERLEKFSELIATAIANAESSAELAASRDALAQLADEQAALRRVATLVARGASPRDVVEAVTEEVGRLLPVESATLGRFEPDGTVTTVGSWSSTKVAFPTGMRWPTEGTNVAWLVLQTGKAARIDDFSAATDPIGVAAREAGYKSAVGSPVVVDGHLWGLISATSREGALPPGTEARLASFTEIVATAIANAKSSSELAASRRRIVAAADEARRRIERDLHDGIQQRLIALTFRARAMTRRPAAELPAIAEELSEGLKEASAELREIARGIHPTILTEAGLGPALRALARRSDIPVDVDVRLDRRLPESVEAAAYYIASEALTNVAKHAHATVVQLAAAHDDDVLTLEVRDDGVGGVDPGQGSGILGLTDRVEALGGTITITSPPRAGTRLAVRLPAAT